MKNRQRSIAYVIKARKIQLAIGAVCIFFTGIIYAWSILKVPLADAFGWGISELAVNFTLTFCFFCLGCMLSGVLLKRIGIRWTIVVSAVLVLTGFTIVSRMSGGSIAVLYMAYGILAGSGIGIAYIAIVSSINSWFPDKPGSSTGVLMMSFGVSSLILGNLANMLFFLPSVGWRATYQGMGVAICIILIFGSIIIRTPGEGDELPDRQVKKSIEDFEIRDYATAEMLRRRSFYLFYFYNVLTAMVGNSVFSYARDFAIFVGAEASLAAVLVGLASVCNGLGRILFGFVYDTIGRRRTMLLANILVIIAPVIALFATVFRSLPLGIASLCCIGLSYGSGSTISATFIGNFFGRKAYSLNLSIVTSALIPASFGAMLASGMISSTGTYISTFIMLICCGFVALALNLCIRKP